MPCKKQLSFAELKNKNLLVLGEDGDIQKDGYENSVKHKYFSKEENIENDPDFEVVQEEGATFSKIVNELDGVVMKKADIW